MKFTPEGGAVAIRTSRRRDGVVLAVEDTGIGIPRAALEKLGQPFEQVQSPLTRNHQGSGLGLAISRSLVALHGGRMDIVSREGAGTRVTVFLPFRPGQAARSRRLRARDFLSACVRKPSPLRERVALRVSEASGLPDVQPWRSPERASEPCSSAALPFAPAPAPAQLASAPGYGSPLGQRIARLERAFHSRVRERPLGNRHDQPPQRLRRHVGREGLDAGDPLKLQQRHLQRG